MSLFVSTINPLMDVIASATLNNMKLVHWPLMGGLFTFGTGRAAPIPSSLHQMYTAHPSTASVQINHRIAVQWSVAQRL